MTENSLSETEELVSPDELSNILENTSFSNLKNEYHNLLGSAKLIFSANLQETLGISWYEGALLDVIPMVPNRLSYSEMAIPEFAYPSEWTEDWQNYLANKKKIIAKIEDYMENYKKYVPLIYKQKEKLKETFFSGNQLYGVISNG